MSRKQDRPRYSISVYAIKTSIRSPNDIVKSRPELKSKDLRIGSAQANLYIAPAEPRVPRWAKIFGSRVDVDKLGISTSSAAGVLLVPTPRRIFALTFGFGRHMLHNEVIEERFGLKATLNAIDPKSIRSLDHRSFESLARQVHEQAARPAEAVHFGLDIEQDMLRAVVGTPEDPSFALRMYGKDAIVANIDRSLENIVDFLERCEDFAQGGRYKTTHPWVDQIAEISDKARISELDDILVDRIRHQKLTDLWLAVPEPIDWPQVDGFKFTTRKTAPTAPDLHLTDFIGTINDLAKLSVKTLKNKRAHMYAHDHQQPLEAWPIYKCLCFETTIDNSTFLLNGGKWYCIDLDFVKKVDAAFGRLPRSTLVLPPCTETDEGDYNKRACEESAGRFILLDRKLVEHGGGRSSIEVCDILTDDRRLVHVKKYGGSSLLSHLFSQAAVAGELLLVDAEFRRKANREISLTTHKFPGDELNPRNYEIVLGVITWSKKPFKLPFFSRVNLRAAARRLEGYGYKVTLLPIPGPRPEPKKKDKA